MHKTIIHLIATAHIDPVWLWDWREGLNEGIATCRTILDLMEEFPELTFTRGEAAIYRHIQRFDPQTFRRISKRVDEGRWEIAGGTWVQPDTNMPATETLLRHFLRGVRYFQEAFGKRIKVAWQADSFGHSAGLPEVLQAAGMESFAFTRPGAAQLPLAEPAFWWEGSGSSGGASGARVLAYRPPVGWYGTERDEVTKRLDAVLAYAANSSLENVACFYGLGNHGGGPTRRQLTDIRAWGEAHPEVKLVHSGLNRLFAALRREIGAKGKDSIPTHRGELNFCLRGCYASAARLKYAYRKSEAAITRAEQTDAAISAALGRKPAKLQEAWDGVLFNSFHDILPGSSIERAIDEQVEWLGAILHDSRKVESDALIALAQRVDTRVAPVTGDNPSAVAALVWNPHPYPFDGHVELEVSLDHRPLWSFRRRPGEVPVRVLDHGGRALPFQLVATEHAFMPDLPWRKRAVVPVRVPALGWTVLAMGLAPEPAAAKDERPAVVLPAKAQAGDESLLLWGAIRLAPVTVEDPWGSWGDMTETPASSDLSTVRHTWKVCETKLLEEGPERSTLWVRLEGGSSSLELRLSQSRGREAVDVSARVLWNERSARLKLVMSGVAGSGGSGVFEVPGGSVTRGPLGEVPGGRWVRVGDFGFASDALYGFNLKDGALEATVVRASRYASDVAAAADETPWLPAADAGELRFRFLLTRKADDLVRLSRELEQPPVVMTVPAKPGALARSGSLAELTPASLRLLALKPAEDGDGFILRAQAPGEADVKAGLCWLGGKLALGKVRRGAIASWRLTRSGGKWRARRTEVCEL